MQPIIIVKYKGQTRQYTIEGSWSLRSNETSVTVKSKKRKEYLEHLRKPYNLGEYIYIAKSTMDLVSLLGIWTIWANKYVPSSLKFLFNKIELWSKFTLSKSNSILA